MLPTLPGGHRIGLPPKPNALISRPLFRLLIARSLVRIEFMGKLEGVPGVAFGNQRRLHVLSANPDMTHRSVIAIALVALGGLSQSL